MIGKWNLWVGVVLSLVVVSVSWAQDAYDDEAFEESADVRQQDLDEGFGAALELMNAGKIGVAVREIKKLAVQGHVQSQHMLGVFFRHGMGVRSSAKRSVQWLKLAAEQDYPLAMVAYAEACIAGEGTRQDYARARELLGPVASKEWNFPLPVEDFGMVRSLRSEASYYLGLLMLEGEGGKKDIEGGLELLVLAANTGSMQASVYLAIEYARGERLERSVEESKRYFDLMELQSVDTVRRSFESLMVEFVDPVVREELKESAEEVGALFSKEILALQTRFAKDLLKKGSEDYDPVFAAALLKLASDGGNAEAQSLYGLLFAQGVGVEQDFERAGVLLGKAAKAGNWMARYNYSVLVLLGKLGDVEDSLVDTYLDDAAAGGVFSAQLVLDGDRAPEVLGRDDDVELIETWVEERDPRVVYARAKREEIGWGFERETNWKKLYKAHLKAAKEGYHRSEYECGRCFYFGMGVDRDVGKALPWLEKAAESNNRSALFRLGWIYDNGEGVAVDAKRSASFYERSVAFGDRASANNLGNLYANGNGVEKDIDRAFELYFMSAEDGDRVAAYNIGYKFLNGEDVEKDVEKGLKWLVDSGEKGYGRSMKELIDYYDLKKESGDVVELAYWTEKLAESGDVGAKKSIAIYYRESVGVPKSNLKSMQWIAAYLSNGYFYNAKMRKTVLDGEIRSEIVDYLPLDYEAVLLYLDLLMDEDWVGYAPDEALDIAKQFSDTRLFEGRFRLAELYLKEELEKSNPRKAVKIYEAIYKDCEKEGGFFAHKAKAAFKLSRLYAKGTQVKRDDGKRAEWMRYAADAGAAAAKYYYAKYLLNGVGVDHDPVAAVRMLLPLMEARYVKATLLLGRLLSDGDDALLPELRDRREDVLGELKLLAESGVEAAQELLEGMGVPFSNPVIEGPEDSGEEVPDGDGRWMPTVLG